MEDLLAMGEAATMVETNGGNLTVNIARWNAVAQFVIMYCGLARALWALEFVSEEHEA